MKITKSNTLSFYNEQGILTLNAKQFDTGRRFIFHITDSDEPFDLSGCNAYLRIAKADGTQFQGHECCTIDGSKIIINTSVGNGSQILTAAGSNICELHLEDTDGISLTTWNFNILVEPRVHDGSHIASVDSYDILDIAKRNEETRQKNEEIRQSKETERQENETQRQENEATRKTKFEIFENRIGEITDEAKSYATNAKSWAVGGTNTRTGEDTDNSRHYYEQIKSIAESFSGTLRPKGTITFANLPALSSAKEGDMYNISNQFTTTADFKEGSGHAIPAGSNIYKTADGKWDILAGTPVTGIKGNEESSYRTGNVNITASNIGALPSSGGTVKGKFNVDINGDGKNYEIRANSGVVDIMKKDSIKNENGTVTKTNYPMMSLKGDWHTAGSSITMRSPNIEMHTGGGKIEIDSDNIYLEGSTNIFNYMTSIFADYWLKHIAQVHLMYSPMNTSGDTAGFKHNNDTAVMGYVEDNDYVDTTVKHGGSFISVVNSGGITASDPESTYSTSKVRVNGKDIGIGMYGHHAFEHHYTDNNHMATTIRGGVAGDAAKIVITNESNTTRDDMIQFITDKFKVVNHDNSEIFEINKNKLTLNNDTVIKFGNRAFISGNAISLDNMDLQISWDEFITSLDYYQFYTSCGTNEEVIINIGLFTATYGGIWGYSKFPLDLGTSTYKWRNIYATNGTIQISDRNKKKSINELSREQAKNFIYGLKPSTYQMDAGTSGRTHWGIISQDIEELLKDLGWTSLDFAGFIKSPKTRRITKDENGNLLKKPIEEVVENEYDYSLRYDEFIAPIVKVIQVQHEEIETLKQEMALIKQQMADLSNKEV